MPPIQTTQVKKKQDNINYTQCVHIQAPLRMDIMMDKLKKTKQVNGFNVMIL